MDHDIRKVLVSLAAAFIGIPFAMGADAPSRQDLFYYGEARVTNLFSGQMETQKIILEKILDPKAGLLTEIACYQEKGKAAKISPIYMQVSGSSLTISDTLTVDQPAKLTGTGTLYGKNWDWSFLKFSMNFTGGVKIEDVNFVVQNKLIGRKQIYLPNGSPVQLWEIEMISMTPEDYKKSYKAMECK